MSGEPEDDSTLYENALRQANQEAAGDCASIAEDALAQKDYDKAVIRTSSPFGWM